VKVLVTGGDGQLGRALVRLAPPHVGVVAAGRGTLDLTDGAAMRRSLEEARPAVVLNAAAYTAVDRAESDRAGAFAVNAIAVEGLARLCATLGIRLIHVSTDFVFDGTQGRPYEPHDVPQPLNVYGESKLAGERAVAATPGLDWRIIRTAWVYAAQGRNFVLTMLRLFREREQVSVVADQVGSPTSATSLAGCLWRAADDVGSPEIFHFTDAGVASWYDFAVAIHEEARAIGLIRRPVEILPIASAQYPTPARRPAYSVLSVQPTAERLKLARIHWRSALRDTLRDVVA
jgi:dTDP-4-dehydrorhamnose reductase